KPRREFTALKLPLDAGGGERGKPKLQIGPPEPPVTDARFAPDLKTLVASQGRELVVWDVQRGDVIATMNSEGGDQGGSIVLSSDGGLLAMVDRRNSGSDVIRIFDLKSRRRIASFESGQGRPRSFAFSPEGSQLVTAMEDGTALVWDLAAAASIGNR